MEREFFLIEKDEDGFFVGDVPSLKACYSQGKTIDELMRNMCEVIQRCLESKDETASMLEFAGVQKVSIDDKLAHPLISRDRQGT